MTEKYYKDKQENKKKQMKIQVDNIIKSKNAILEEVETENNEICSKVTKDDKVIKEEEEEKNCNNNIHKEYELEKLKYNTNLKDKILANSKAFADELLELSCSE